MLDRLVFRKHYGLAIQIAKHMKLTESRILEHWATHQVQHGKGEWCKKDLHFNIYSEMEMTEGQAGLDLNVNEIYFSAFYK